MLSSRQPLKFLSKNIRAASDFVKVIEVGPRDGLQNEPKIVPTSTKIELIDRLSQTGLSTIEVTSFVSPKWIPQMADSSQVFRNIKKNPKINYPVLVPNLKGLEAAMEVGASEIAIFGAASETFSRKNINCSIDESIGRFTKIAEICQNNQIKIRAYVSCVVGCPYEGQIKPSIVAKISSAMLEIGAYEVSLGDTIGVGTPKKFDLLLQEIRSISGFEDLSKFAIHCHDTYGQALANIYACLENNVRIFDSSVGGLGGCPYAAGASGNVATEDLLYLLHGQGMRTDVDLNEIVEIGDWISKELERENRSRVGHAMLSRKIIEKSCN